MVLEPVDSKPSDQCARVQQASHGQASPHLLDNSWRREATLYTLCPDFLVGDLQSQRVQDQEFWNEDQP